MRTLPLTALAALACAGLLHMAPAHADRRVIILQETRPQGPRLAMSAPMLAAARDAAARDAQDAGRPPAAGTEVKLPQMRVSAIATTVDGRREVLLQDADNPQNTASMQWDRTAGDPAVQFSVGQAVNFEPAGSGKGWQVRDSQGRPLEYVPEASGPRDLFDTRD